MKNIFFCLFLSFIFLDCKVEPSNLETIETQYETGTTKEKYSRKKDDFAKQGPYTSFYPSGKVMEEAHYENDTIHGERKMYFESGQVEIIEQYENGEFIGTYRDFYENGNLKSEGSYVDNEMDGEWKFYFETSELREKVTFKGNDENGPFQDYHKNGKVAAEGFYKNGDKEHGILKKYDEAGELIEKMNCMSGICMTIWTKEDGDVEVDETKFQEMVEKIKALEDKQ